MPLQDGRVAAVAGATGLVGRALVARLCANPAVAAVHALARRPLGFAHAKLTLHPVDYAALPALPPLTEAYLALGTTIKVAGSQMAFRAIDFDLNLAVARAARTAGARRLGLVSALGANARSRIFYSRIKGELEDALAQLDLDALAIARPSLLRGDRAALGAGGTSSAEDTAANQQELSSSDLPLATPDPSRLPHQAARPGESWAIRLDALLRPILPARWRAIDAADVAAALVQALPDARGRVVLSSAAMQGAHQRAA